MASKTDLRTYFECKAAGSDGPVAKKQIANSGIIIPATENINRVEIEMVIDEVEKSTTWNKLLQQNTKKYSN